jgi:hypothetical protein
MADWNRWLMEQLIQMGRLIEWTTWWNDRFRIWRWFGQYTVADLICEGNYDSMTDLTD